MNKEKKNTIIYILLAIVIVLLVVLVSFLVIDESKNRGNNVSNTTTTTTTTTTNKINQKKLFSEEIDIFETNIVHVDKEYVNTSIVFTVEKNDKTSKVFNFASSRGNSNRLSLTLNNKSIISVNTCDTSENILNSDNIKYILGRDTVYFVIALTNVPDNSIKNCGEFDVEQNMIYVFDQNGAILFTKDYPEGQSQYISDEDYSDLFKNNFYVYNNKIYYMEKLNYGTVGEEETWNINEISINDGVVSNVFYNTIKGGAAGAKS